MCVLNGRLCPLNDNFTSISHRGKAVVDYMITPHHNFNHFSNFSVKTMSNLVRELNMVDGGFTRVSDHSLLEVYLKPCTEPESDTTDVRDTEAVEYSSKHTSKSMPTQVNINKSELGLKYGKPPTKYKRGQLPEEFMGDENVLTKFSDLIDKLLVARGDQQEVDDLYDNLVHVYHEEVSKFLKIAKVATNSRRSLRHVKKPYWNETLSELWYEFHNAELKYVKMNRSDTEYQSSRLDFLNKQRTFDKENKRCRIQKPRAMFL